MNQEEYLQTRVDDQIAWYDRKSTSNQRWYRRLRVWEIVAAAAIPLLAGYADWMTEVKLVVGFLGFLVAVIAGFLSLYQLQENWIAYRSACELLKREKYLFLARIEPYHVNDPFPLFVQRVENLMAKEHTQWAQEVKGTPEPT